MSSEKYKHVFGPVPSRRLGRSLGVDLVPFKTCTYDCLYCQLGKTTDKTIDRREYVPVDEVLEEIRRKFADGVQPDYVTLSGSGEPTLHSGCGRIIRGIKEITDTPVAVLTNGSLLWDPQVRQDLAEADLVVPSLDAGTPETFEEVNKGHHEIGFDRMVEGLIKFRREFKGQVWLEVFMLDGLTATDEEVARMAAIAEKIGPDRIQLNTVARPPAYKTAGAVSEKEMNRLAGIFGEKAEVVADFGGAAKDEDLSVTKMEVLAMLERRPCTLDDVSVSLKIHRNEAIKHLDHLVKEGLIIPQETGGKTYYMSVQHG